MKVPFLEKVEIEIVLGSNKISLVKKTIKTLMVTYIMIIKLSHYI